jgi:hypothetical protein
VALIDEYQAAANTDFITKIGMALVHAAVPVLVAGVATTDAEKRSVRFAVRVMLNPYAEGLWVARALSQAGMTVASTDVALQTAIDSNWAAMSWTRDQLHGVGI